MHPPRALLAPAPHRAAAPDARCSAGLRRSLPRRRRPPPTRPTSRRLPRQTRRTSRPCRSSAHRAPRLRRRATRTPTARAATCAPSCRRLSRAWWPSTGSTSPTIAGTGRGGRVTKKDVEEHLAGGAAAAAAPAAPATPVPASSAATPAAPVQAPDRRHADPAAPRRPPATRSSSPCRRSARSSRATCARSVDNAVHVSTFFEVDMTRCWSVRAAVNKELTADLRRQGLVPAVHHARGGRGDPALAVGQRRGPRHRHRRQAARQPRRGRLDQRRQGPRRPRHPQRRGAQPARA